MEFECNLIHKLTMANLFNSVKIKQKKRNKFNISHSSRLTTEFGRLTPILCEPVIPADKFKVNTTLKIRFAPMTFPVMERFKAYVHYWFVPNRLIWSNWEKFITGGETGLEDQEHPYPYIKVGENTLQYGEGGLDGKLLGAGTLFDYLGFPAIDRPDSVLGHVTRDKEKHFDALPFKAYHLIYNEFYRDQNLERPLELHIDRDADQDNDDDNEFENALLSIKYHAWRKDYFTSALPDPQRGPEVTLPLIGGNVSITSDSPLDVISDTLRIKDRQPAFQEPREMQMHTSSGSRSFLGTKDGQYPDNTNVEIAGTLETEEVEKMRLNFGTDGIRSASINEIRRGFALQRLYEIAARVGGRYVENILGNFGVFAGDARLQRPEYLGGSSLPIYVGDVLQTSESTDDGTPLGMPAGVAGALGSSRAFTRTFREHGWIIGILFIQPDATYFQGLPRKFNKFDRLDYLWPTFANIGEQEIKNEELYFDWLSDDTVNKAGLVIPPLR